MCPQLFPPVKIFSHSSGPSFFKFAFFLCCTAPGDYTAVGEDLIFTAANVVGSTVCTNVTIIDDEVLEGDQSFSLSLSSTDPVMFGTDEATVTIVDNDSESDSL